MKKQMKRLMTLMLALVLVMGLTPAWAADTTGYYTATQIEEMGGKVANWEYLLANYGVKEANVYGWYCSQGDTESASGFWFYHTPDATLLGSRPTTQEKWVTLAAEGVKNASEKMYQYLTTDDLTFEEALGKVSDVHLPTGATGTFAGEVETPPLEFDPDPEETTSPVIATPTPHEPVNPDITFVDVAEDAWYYDAVMALAKSGIVNGKGNGVFDPNAVITRGEMAALICRLDARVNAVRFSPGETISTYTLGERTYNETTSWAHEYMMGLYDKAGGIAHPFYPIWDPESFDKPVYRGEAAEICLVFATRMTRYVKTVTDDDGSVRFYPYKTNERYRIADGAVGLNFSSVELVSYIPDLYASTACNEMGCGVKYPNGKDKVRDHNLTIDTLKWAYLLDIMHGVDKAGNSNAHGTLTRAEFCQMLYNMQLTSGDNIGNPRYVPNDYYVVKGFGAK